MFRDSFKYYKSRKPPPDLTNAIDIENPDPGKVKRIKATLSADELPKADLGLRSSSTWEIFEIFHIPGFIFIRNPFTSNGQRYWITKCLKDYSGKPNKLNIDAHGLLDNDETWWDISTGDSERGAKLRTKLRWATIGYHHNWDTKHYSEDSRSEMPCELSAMSELLAKVIGFNDFKAEAAIVNYYRMNSTLAGHTDHSEIDRRAPLFSISFGQSAIFLIGGLTPNEPAAALLLRSGDVVAMTGESRLRYHGVPKILPADTAPWDLDHQDNNNWIDLTRFDDWGKARTFISEARININVRQVLRSEQSCL